MNCLNEEGLVSEYTCDSFSNEFLSQLNKKSCNKKCGKCSWDKIVFENVPFWLVRELREENRTVASFKESANLIFDDKITFKLLCVYDL